MASTDSRKPASPIIAGIDEEQDGRRRPEGGGRAPGPAALAGEEHDGGHHGGADHGRGGAGGNDVRDDRHEHAERDDAPRSPAQDGPDEAADDRDVPARDRDDVADAGRREVGGERAVDAFPQPDEDARGQPCLGLGQRPSQGVASRVPERLERRRWRADDAERPCLERPGGTRPPEVLAVRVVVGRRTEPARRPRRTRRRHCRPGRERRRDRRRPTSRVRHEAQPRDLVPVPRRPDRLDHRRPRPVVSGSRGATAWPGPASRRKPSRTAPTPAARPGVAPARHRPPLAAAPAVTRAPDRDHRGGRNAGHHAGRRAGRDADRDPAGARDPAPDRAHGPTVTSGRIFSRAAAPSTLRVPRSSTVENRCCCRAATILAAVTGPTPGSVSSCSGVAALRSMRPGAVDPPPGAGPARAPPGPPPAVGLAADGDVHLVAVLERGREVELPIRAVGVHARPEAARRGDRRRRSARPGGSRYTPGATTAPPTSTTTRPSLARSGRALAMRR